MTSVGTAELRARLGIPENMLHRLIRRDIIRPIGSGGSGSRFEYDEAEQRAVAAVVRLMQSHLMAENKSPRAAALRDSCLRSVAEAARAPLPLGARARWLILLADGSCIRGDDWLASSMLELRTLIELDA